MSANINPKSEIRNPKSRVPHSALRNYSVAIVGYGKVGRVLARGFAGRGYRLFIVAHKPHPDSWLTRRQKRVVNRIAELPADMDFVVLCVRDRQIPVLANEVVKRDGFRRGTVVCHTAGALSADVLAPIRKVGCLPLAWHPLQTFTGDEDADLLKGITFGIDGDPKAVRVGEKMARALGGKPFRVPPELRPLYHLGGVFACNLMAALGGISQDLLKEVGMDERRSLAALAPLIRTTAQNISRKELPDAITGPLKRGDVETIAAHLKVLERHPLAGEIYRVLSRSLLHRLPEVRNRKKLQTLLG